MKISVLIPYYNDKSFLSEAVQSVLDQSFTDFELILINHASKDSSREIARSFNDPRIKHIDLEINQGAGGGHILQAALNVATGEYFKTFCADDVMKSSCLKDLSRFLDNSPEFTAVFGNMDCVDEIGLSLGQTWWSEKKANKIDLSSDLLLKEFLNGHSTLPYPAALVRTEALRGIKIDKVLHTQFDMTLWVQLLAQGKKFKLLSDSVCDYRIHPEQASSGGKARLIRSSSYFESINYCESFLEMKSVTLVKEVLQGDLFAEVMGKNDVELIPFVLAHHFSLSHARPYRIYGFLKLAELMQGDIQEAIRNKFGYDVKDLRQGYAAGNLDEPTEQMKTKELVKILRRRFKQRLKAFLFRKKMNVI